MCICFVDEAIVPRDVQTDKYEPDDSNKVDHNAPDEFPVNVALWQPNTLYYITLHYITLHYITLHYITLHYITLHYIFTELISKNQWKIKSNYELCIINFAWNINDDCKYQKFYFDCFQ